MIQVSTPVRVLVVDDHPVARFGLMTALDAAPGVAVAGEAGTVADALTAATDLHPAVVVVPLRLGGRLAGTELCRDIRAAVDTRIVFFTAFASPEETTECFLSGADSYVHRTASVPQVVEAIRATAAGRRMWMSAADGITDGRARLESKAAAAALTPREREVLSLILTRRTNAEIAADLGVEVTTVKTHVRNVLMKVGADSRRDLFTR